MVKMLVVAELKFLKEWQKFSTFVLCDGKWDETPGIDGDGDADKGVGVIKRVWFYLGPANILALAAICYAFYLPSVWLMKVVMVEILLLALMVVCFWCVLKQAGYSLSSMKHRYKETIAVLTTALEFRDPYTHGHSQRVAYWCRKIAEEMHLSPTEIEQIELGGLLHDVGKVGVPDHILKKNGQLTRDEYNEVKKHPVIGERILKELTGMEYVAAMARQHHLYYDGAPQGYPDSYPGSQALLGSRILGVADAWDAMTGDRPYRRSLTIPEGVAELRANAGKQFDPEVVEAFIRTLKAQGIYSDGQESEGVGVVFRLKERVKKRA